jgi:hypothetical protein
VASLKWERRLLQIVEGARGGDESSRTGMTTGSVTPKKPKNSSVPLGGGSFEPPHQLLSTHDARKRFLQIATTREPEIVNTLRAVYERVAQDSASWSCGVTPFR